MLTIQRDGKSLKSGVCVTQKCVCVSVTGRYRSVVEKFLNLDLEDKDLDLQRFMKEELLPSAGELLIRS